MNRQRKQLFTKAYSIMTIVMLMATNFMPLLNFLPVSAIAQESDVTTVVEEVVTPTQQEEVTTPVVEEVVETPAPTVVEETPEVVAPEVKEDTTAPEVVEEKTTDEETVPPVVEVSVADSGNGALNTVVENALYDCNATSTISCVITNKADYKPTETVKVFGYSYLANTEYKLIIYSNDAPAVSHEVVVSTDFRGDFTYDYQLDGVYRVQYYIEVHKLNADISSSLVSSGSFTDGPGNPSADIDQCGNGSLSSPDLTPCQGSDPAGEGWVNGNLGSSKSHYYEGDSIPYRLKFSNLSNGAHSVVIEWDTTKGGTHALDYLTSYNRTVNANPCADIVGCGAQNTFAIPSDPQVTGAGVTPASGVFSLFGGTITSVSAYSYPNGAGFTGDKSARITINFTATQSNPVLAWGGHIATRSDWGALNSAVTISGSPYHTRLIDLDGSGGNQDRSLSADAVIFPASITIIKQANVEGPTSFPFTATPTPLSNFSLVDNGTSANTKVFSNITDFKTYTVTEGTSSLWSLQSIVCGVTSPNGGSQSTNGSTATINLKEGENVTCTYNNNINYADLTVVKNVVNDNGGNAVVGDFAIKMNNSLLSFGAGVVNGSTTKYTATPSVSAGNQYTLTENTNVAGYVAGTWSCVDNNTQQSVSHPITLNSAQSVTCTITNNDVAPQLTVVKNVVNDNGGNAVVGDFAIKMNNSLLSFGAGVANGSTTAYTSIPSVSSNTAYTLTENTNVEGYVAGTWSCVDNNTQSTVSNPVTLNEGQNVTCTISNNDVAPKLTVIKDVVNDNGGNAVVADFDIKMNNNGLTFGVGVANGSTTTYTSTPSVSSNTSYSLTENTNVAGYVAGSWVCKDDSTQSTVSNPVTLNEGQQVTCKVVNNDIAPTLTVIKHVINDNGGNAVASDFDIKLNNIGLTFGVGNVNGSTTSYTSTPTVTANTAYALTENTNYPGYTAGTWSCKDNSSQATVNIAVGLNEGQNVTCEINNNDIAPKLTVIKHILNDDGGNAVVADFDIKMNNNGLTFGAGSVNGDTTSYTSTPSVSSNTSYTLSENENVAGYVAGTWVCKDDSNDQSVDLSKGLNEGQNATCEITNNDAKPGLTVIKHIVNSYGGNADVSEFEIKMNNNGLSFGTGSLNGDTTTYTSNPSVKANTLYTLTENTSVSGYVAGSWVCKDNNTQNSVSNPVTLNEGQSVTCEITNTEKEPKLTVIKHVDNKYGGNATVEDFDLELNENGLTFGEGEVTGTDTKYTSTPEVNSNEQYTLDENENVAGYVAGTWVCTDDNDPQEEISTTFTLSEGQHVTCEITNTEREPKLTVIKDVVNDNGGDATIDDFDLKMNDDALKFDAGSVNGSTTTYTSTPKVSSNVAYTLSENENVDGYVAGTWVCTDDNSELVDVSNPVTLSEGQHVTCKIINNDVAPSLTVIKHVDNKYGGNATVEDFDLELNGGALTFGDGEVSGTDTKYTSTPKVSSNVEYTVSENENVSGYIAGSWICTDDNSNEEVPNPVTLNEGQSVTCEITNTEKEPKLTVIKNVINDNGGDAVVEDFDITLNEGSLEFGNGEVEGTTTKYTSTPEVKSNESYTLDENNQFPGYEAGEWVCTDDNNPQIKVNISEGLNEGQEVTCTIDNNDIAPELTVIKHVVNDNGGSATADDFDIKVNQDVVDFTSSNTDMYTTTYTAYPEVMANTQYEVSENTDVNYYDAGTWSCVDTQSEEKVSNPFILNEGQNVTCEITNDDKLPRLEIEKVNNATTDKEVGDQVLYTITVSVKDAAVHNLEVNDFLPDTFNFVVGSSVVKLNGNTQAVTEATYTDGVAKWDLSDLGTLVPGDVVTIEYLGEVTTDTDPGLYKDIAWAKADQGNQPEIFEEVLAMHTLSEIMESDPIFAYAVGSGYQDVNFVGTQVNVVSTDLEEAGVVLGTKTVELPNTGMNPVMLIISAVSALVGLILVLVGSGFASKIAKKFLGGLVAITLGMFVFGSFNNQANAASTLLRVETPATHVNGNFEISYTVSDLNNNTVDVTCYVKKPGDLAFSSFGTMFTTPNGGATGSCVVDATVLTMGDGNYEFKVGTDKTADSSVFTVNYDTVKPGTPTNYEKTENGVCKYDVSFKTANDSNQTVKVEVFRSTQKSFTADATTFAGEVAAGSNESKTFTDSKPDCDKTYFYAVRSVDVAGNTSDFIGDTIVVTQVVNVPGEGNNNGGNTNTNGNGTDNGEVQGETDNNGKPNNGGKDDDNNGEVKGDTDTDNPSNDNKDQENKTSGSWNTVLAWIGGAVLGIIAVWQLASRGILQALFQKIMRR